MGDLHEYNLETDAWRPVQQSQPRTPRPRSGHCFVSQGKELWKEERDVYWQREKVNASETTGTESA